MPLLITNDRLKLVFSESGEDGHDERRRCKHFETSSGRSKQDLGPYSFIQALLRLQGVFDGSNLNNSEYQMRCNICVLPCSIGSPSRYYGWNGVEL